jgi:flagellin-like protein
MKKLRLNRKGVSPVIAELLMVAIAVAASLLVTSMAYSWVNQQRNHGMQVVNERLIAEDVWFRNTTEPTKNITLFITNVGRTDLQVSYVLVNETEQWEGAEYIRMGETRTFNVTLESVWVRDREYIITVITERGNQFVSEWWSPRY